MLARPASPKLPLAEPVVSSSHGRKNPVAVQHVASTKEENDKILHSNIDEKDRELDAFDQKDIVPKKRLYGSYVDLPEGLPDEGSALTIRALVVGTLLGSIVGASSIYLGLKTGFTFGAALFGAILGWGILKPLSHFTGGFFGSKENCTVQTTATAAGGLPSIFVAAVPAMYGLGLLGSGPREDFGKLLALNFITAYYGLFFAIPLRKYFILQLKLVFPSPFAAASTIASLHTVTGAAVGKKKAYIMFLSIIGTILWNVIGSVFIPGLYKMRIFAWLSRTGCGSTCWEAHLWGWAIEWTPAFIGAGMLTGLHSSVSFFLGSVTAWGIVGPLLVANKLVAGKGYLSMPGKSVDASSPTGATARYWLLWPGIMVMIAASFTELFWNWRTMVAGFKGLYIQLFRRNSASVGIVGDEDEDPAGPEEQPKAWMWDGGLVASIVLTVIVGSTMFGVGVGEGILSVILAFVFAFIGFQASGTTDINPTGAIAKTAQFVYGGITRAKGMTEPPLVQNAQMQNLISGAVASAAASQAVEMVGDLKTGHLLRASPKTQFLAQAIGTFFATFISLGLYVFYVDAYPCINTVYANKEGECKFELTAASAWAATAIALTQKNPGIPHTAAVAALIIGALTVCLIIARKMLPPRFAWVIPNMSAIGVAWVVQETKYGNAMLLGSTIAYFWSKRNAASWEIWGFALASGFIAGEGLGGLISAALEILNFEASSVGSNFACNPKTFGSSEVPFCG
ncbi:OPT oligopeptide transporter protein-domain-containing protein [Fimicolochytrium jonesii]|uniref:OPT oligopeptide transporter protein-domain-containing protein n=1 Tax=Fimicolochytrium jonesii TaxID=1396493 RepID=UPI0022FDD7B9|nr:OPT oligopeptide transporter protein-domain-containing protein [Fimicolochytrium jonesii]KAI8823098.1 OPT oligopeptide transporter protein-domain-containing protein [Fimicolochytrium jonesii]